MAENAETPTPSAETKRTNGRACVVCHRRKVRCDILERGIPCSNCQSHEGSDCRIYEKKKTRSARARAARQTHGRGQQSVIAPAARPSASSWTGPGSPAERPDSALPRPGVSIGHHRRGSGSQPVPRVVASGAGNPDDDQQSTGNLADFIDREDVREQEIPKGGRLYFIGTEFSNLSYLVRQRSHRPNENVFHFGSRPYARKAPQLPPEALKLPSKTLSEELLQAYFVHINRGFPIVDEVEFMKRYRGRDANTPAASLLLLNAVFLVGAHVLSQGRPDMRTLKLEFFRRTKMIFDSRIEEHREAYIQSALLLTWQCDDLEDVVSNSWHWVGVAARTLFGMGIHRNAMTSNLNTLDKRQWIRWWWTLFQFDVMVSIAYGRPQAIRLDESDVSSLQEHHFEGIPDAEALFSIHHTRLCIIFSKAMRQWATVQCSAGDRAEATRQADDELAQFITNLPERLQLSASPPDTWQSLLHLTYNNFLILLHRPSPRLNMDPKQHPPEAASDLSICWDAAVVITSIFETLRSKDALSSLWLPAIYVLFTAMVHVTGQLRSANPVVAAKSLRMFDSLLLSLRGLAPHWLYAQCLLRLFEHGKTWNSNNRQKGHIGEAGSVPAAAGDSQPVGHGDNGGRDRRTTSAPSGVPEGSRTEGFPPLRPLPNITQRGGMIGGPNNYLGQTSHGGHDLQAGYGFNITPPEEPVVQGTNARGMPSNEWAAYSGNLPDDGLGIDEGGFSWDMMPDPSALEFLLAGMGQEYDF